MSRNAYASSLRSLGGSHRTKGPSVSAGGTGSGTHTEDGAESAAPGAEVGVVPDQVASEVAVADPVETGDVPRVKRVRTQGTKPPRPKNIASGDEFEDLDDLEELVGGPVFEVNTSVEGGSAPGSSRDRVGVHSVKKVVKIMSQIPSDEDWARMKESGLNVVMQKCAEHWGHVSFVSYNTCFGLN